MLPSAFAATIFPGWHALSSITRDYLEDGLEAVQAGHLPVEVFVGELTLYLAGGDVTDRVLAWVRDTTQARQIHAAYAESAGL